MIIITKEHNKRYQRMQRPLTGRENGTTILAALRLLDSALSDKESGNYAVDDHIVTATGPLGSIVKRLASRKKFYEDCSRIFFHLGLSVAIEQERDERPSMQGPVFIIHGPVPESYRYCAGIILGQVEMFLDSDPDFLTKITHLSILSPFGSYGKLPASDVIRAWKYSTAWPLAKLLSQELPEKEESFFLDIPYTGCLRRYIRRRLLDPCRHNVHLFNSYFQSKRACPSVPDSFIARAFEKHRKALSAVPLEVPSDLGVWIDERVDEILESFTPYRPELEPCSHNACFEQNRANGGQYSYVQHLEATRTGPRSTAEIGLRELLFAYEPRPGSVKWVYGYPTRMDFPTMQEQASLHELRKRSMQCKVAAVLEPLKVRLVTKGRGLAYALARSLQRWLHGNLKRLPIFKLIGRSVTNGDLRQFFDKLRPCELMVSGDYAGATDTLNINVSKRIFERILLHIYSQNTPFSPNLSDIEVYRRVLYEHEIIYPPIGDTPSQSVMQRNGQLMGSVLSFPILCIANLLTMWYAKGENLPLGQLNGFVNGDDILFGCTKEEYAKWKIGVDLLGFKLSVGKNFFHERFCTINSVMFDRERRCSQIRIPFFQSGLLLGRSKVQSDPTEELMVPIKNLQLVIDGARDPTRALSRYMAYHHDSVRELTQGLLSLGLPEYWGGFGLDLSRAQPGPIRITRFQRQYAAYLLSRDEFRHEVLRPHYDSDVLPLPPEELEPQQPRYYYRKDGCPLMWSDLGIRERSSLTQHEPKVYKMPINGTHYDPVVREVRHWSPWKILQIRRMQPLPVEIIRHEEPVILSSWVPLSFDGGDDDVVSITTNPKRCRPNAVLNSSVLSNWGVSVDFQDTIRFDTSLVEASVRQYLSAPLPNYRMPTDYTGMLTPELSSSCIVAGGNTPQELSGIPIHNSLCL